MNNNPLSELTHLFSSPYNVKLSVFFLFVYLVIYGVFMENREWYYNVDEIRDLYGSRAALEVYLCNGRWGMAIYKRIFLGTAPLNGVLIAGIWLTLALILQINILQLKALSTQLLYGLVVLCVTSLSTHLTFANQSDVLGLGIFLSTLGVYLCLKDKLYSKIAGGGLYLASIAFYQSLVLNIFVLFAGKAILAMIPSPAHSISHVSQEETIPTKLRELFLQMVPLCIALAVYALISQCAANSSYVSTNIREHVEMYQSAFFHPSSYFSNPLDTLGNSATNLIHLMAGKGQGPLFKCCLGLIVFCSVLMMKSNRRNLGHNIFIALSLLILTAAPFMIPIVGNGNPSLGASVRSFTAAPFACAIIWVSACKLIGMEKKAWANTTIILLMIPFILKASYQCGEQLKSWKSGCSITIRQLLMLEHEAKMAHAAQGNTQDLNRIILFGGEKLFPFKDLYHPYIQFIQNPTKKDQTDYAEKISEMPIYPAPGSIYSVNGDTVIVNFQKK